MSTQDDEGRRQLRYSRRSFLGRAGAGAVAVGTAGTLGVGAPRAMPGAAHAGGHASVITQHFGRIFGRMRPFAPPGTKGLEAALSARRAGSWTRGMRSSGGRSI
jgi:hypothetical protein